MEECFTKIYTPSWVFFALLKLYKWYHIVQRITFYSHDKKIGKHKRGQRSQDLLV